MNYGLNEVQEKMNIASNYLKDITNLVKNKADKITEIENKTNRNIQTDRAEKDILYTRQLKNDEEYYNSIISDCFIWLTKTNDMENYLESIVEIPLSMKDRAKQEVERGWTPSYPSSDYEQCIEIMKSYYNNFLETVRNLSSKGTSKLRLLSRTNNYYNNELYNTLKLYYKIVIYDDKLTDFFQQLYENSAEKYNQSNDDYYNNSVEKANEEINKVAQEENMIINKKIDEFKNFLDYDFTNEYISKTFDIKKGTLKNDNDITIPLGKYGVFIGNIEQSSELFTRLFQSHLNYIEGKYLASGVSWYLSEKHNIIFHEITDRYNALNEVNGLIFNELQALSSEDCKLDVCCSSGNLDNLDTMANFCTRFPKMTTGKVLTQKEEINELLDNYINEINDIIQNKISKYGSLQGFNKANKFLKIPYRILYLVDIPLGFDEDMLKKLQLILSQGNRAGVQVVIITGKKKEELPVDQNGKYISSIDRMYMDTIDTEYTFMKNDSCWRNIQNVYIDFIIDEKVIDYNAFVTQFEENYELKNQKILRLTDIVDENNQHSLNSTEKLSIPIGINEYGQIQRFEMGDTVAQGTSHYAIIAGATGSGKSSLLQTIIMSSAMSYSPDELELYLLDFKKGNEFKIYENYPIPHIKVLALDTMQEYGENILKKLWAILEQRNELFEKVSKEGIEIKSISDYRKAGYKMPRILVIMDEVQVLFDNSQNVKMAERISSKMADFISRARVYGIHFVFATQTMKKLRESTSLSSATLDEMHIRIGLQCSESESQLLFGSMNSSACLSKFSIKRGSGVYLENDIAKIPKPTGMQVAYIDSESQKILLTNIANNFKEYDEKIKIFKGKYTPKFETEYIDLETKKMGKQRFLIGEALSLENKVDIEVSKKKRNNVLVIGDDQNLLDNITKVWLETAIKYNDGSNNKNIYLLDGSLMIDEEQLISEEYIQQNKNNVEVCDNIFRVIPIINEIYDRFIQRKMNMINGKINDSDKEIIHLIISNIQWVEPIIRILSGQSISDFEMETNLEDNEPDSFMDEMEDFLNSLKQTSSISNNKTDNYKKISIFEKFKTILESGYLCGIETIVTCSETIIAKSIFKSSNLACFTNRIMLKMPQQDLIHFVDTDIKMQNLYDNIALFSDGRKAPFLFKPFEIN